MSLEAALAAVPKTVKGPACGVALYRQAASPADVDFLDQQLARTDDPFLIARLSAALRAEGHEVSASTLRRHQRRGTADGCKCP